MREDDLADDNTLFAIQSNVSDLIEISEHAACTVLKWFNINDMKPNEVKSDLVVTEVAIPGGRGKEGFAPPMFTSINECTPLPKVPFS